SHTRGGMQSAVVWQPGLPPVPPPPVIIPPVPPLDGVVVVVVVSVVVSPPVPPPPALELLTSLPHEATAATPIAAKATNKDRANRLAMEDGWTEDARRGMRKDYPTFAQDRLTGARASLLRRCPAVWAPRRSACRHRRSWGARGCRPGPHPTGR